MKKIIFSSIILAFFFILIYISIDSKLRRSILGLSGGLLNNYYSILIERSLNIGEEKNIKKSIELIENQIKITDFITTNQKNSFIDNIYANAFKVEENIRSKENLLYFSKIIKKLIEKEPNIYNALIWEAKITKILNDNEKKIYGLINSAIKLSPSNIEAYKFVLDYTSEKKDLNNFRKYCDDYHNSILGNSSSKWISSRFSETSLTRFAIQIESKQEKNVYIMESVELNNAQNYKFNLKEPTEISTFQFLSNFFPGTLIEVLEINLQNSNGERIKINPDDIYIILNNAFLITTENTKKIMTTSSNDEKLIFKFKKNYKGISDLEMKINFSKANITNKLNC